MPATTWQEGDIAYLKPHTDFDRLAHKELITSNRMNPGATGHPCVILKVLPGDRIVVTTISAYGSGDHNNHAAPWISKRCYSRDQWWFRSFKGSECSNNNLKPLQLIPGQAMPKPKTSWLFIKNVYDVPLSVIGRFTKPRNGKLLKMAPDSLADLRKDIASRSPYYKSHWGFVNTPSHMKRGSTTANWRKPRALPEAPALTSHKRPTATITTDRPPTQAHPRNGSAPMRQSHSTTAPATLCGPETPLKPRSWANIATKSAAPTPLVKTTA